MPTRSPTCRKLDFRSNDATDPAASRTLGGTSFRNHAFRAIAAIDSATSHHRTREDSGEPASPERSVVDSRRAEDALLVEQLLAGSAAAWEQLIDRYGVLVRSRVAEVAALFGRGCDWSTIDDVTAEVFTTLLVRDAAVLRSFRRESRLSTYLAVIATRIARRAVARLVRTELQATDASDPIDPCSVEPVAELHAIGREERERLLTLVDRLPERQKDLLIAFYREEQTYAEISHRFDIPIGSIGTTLRRAEQKLRKWIDEEAE